MLHLDYKMHPHFPPKVWGASKSYIPKNTVVSLRHTLGVLEGRVREEVRCCDLRQVGGVALESPVAKKAQKAVCKRGCPL